MTGLRESGEVLHKVGETAAAGVLSPLATALLVLIPLAGIGYTFGLPELFGIALWREQFALGVLGVALAAMYLTVRVDRTKGVGTRAAPPWYDIVLAALALIICGYSAWHYESLIAYGYAVGGVHGVVKVVFAATTVLMVIEGVRRMAGWALVILVLAALLYAVFPDHVPGALSGTRNDLDHVVIYLHLDPAGILGTPLGVTVTVVLAYVFLGNALFRLGGGQLFLDIALGSMGRYRGGAAKASVVASSLFGSVSGSAVANVVTTGIVTIPLMKRTGFTAVRAGAIEAVASTGGQLLPPIMGAAAFIMADFLDISYAVVAAAAVLPALLFYGAVFFQIHFNAARTGMVAIAEIDRPAMRRALGRGWLFLVPLGVLIYVLFFTARQPEEAAYFATALVVVAAAIVRDPVPGLRAIVAVLEGAGRALLDIVMIVAAAGIVIGVLNVTGLAFSLSLVLLDATGGNVAVLLVISALVALVLGMGMPTTAVYVLMASLIAPALVQAGVQPIAAHLFVLYFGVLSMITPPICIAAFTAASIAGGGFMRTGFAAVKLGLVAFIVPFLFVFSPDLLLQGDSMAASLWAFATGLAGVMFFAAATEGYLLRPLRAVARLLCGVVGLALLMPAGLHTFGLASVYTDAAGLLIGIPLVTWLWYSRRVQSETALPPSAGAEAIRAQPVTGRGR